MRNLHKIAQEVDIPFHLRAFIHYYKDVALYEWNRANRCLYIIEDTGRSIRNLVVDGIDKDPNSYDMFVQRFPQYQENKNLLPPNLVIV